MDNTVRELLVYRHGHARQKGADTDFERELRDKGKRNAQRIGVWLEQHKLLPDHVLTSPAIRAKNTAEKTCKTAGLGSSIISPVDRLYRADGAALLLELRQLPQDAKRAMLVGHNPALEQLLLDISRDPVPENEKGGILTPASLAWLKLDCSWEELGSATAELVEIVDPKTLPREFPFPDINGEERRVRPAYYYSQSSVIPYRVTKKQGLQVLIVSSSKKKHWVIPKGIHDPGLTAQESAAKEALEEAGVQGTVAQKEIGHYSYPKWDAVCQVKVYPMKVEHVLDEVDWEERHRGRRWVSPKQAMKMLENNDAKRIVGLLPLWLEEQLV